VTQQITPVEYWRALNTTLEKELCDEFDKEIASQSVAEQDQRTVVNVATHINSDPSKSSSGFLRKCLLFTEV
jgi:hypothetical protein